VYVYIFISYYGLLILAYRRIYNLSTGELIRSIVHPSAQVPLNDALY
jgi:hypothetical protein